MKTVELIVEEKEWNPQEPRFTLDVLVHLQIDVVDLKKRTMVKAAGEKWDS
ncbi:hypothetical protein [Geomesophilobacter sediminis]|uniref:Uncharacterized protein n=1 Tax=Geomesophilobacter sediminis TaxID=2798584 RepID=A0A8J7LY64_9BACT|nr:hypothetical protein [Geomesophilobacter sediminis]MBJ6724162.1 hypothetical protein [Geomesophilobacter sediminis]